MKHTEVSFIQAAIPSERGKARHIERFDDIAQTVFNTEGEVSEVHTTQDVFRRLHEVLHARHTNVRSYKGRRAEVRQLIEDCRLHMMHWPWKSGDTPQIIADDVDAMFAFEKKRRAKVLKETGTLDPFGDFAQQLRMNATYMGMRRNGKVKRFDGAGRRSRGYGYQALADNIYTLIRAGRHEEAAAMMEKAFFYDDGDKPSSEREGDKEGDGPGSDKKKKKKGRLRDGDEFDAEGDELDDEDDEGKWGVNQVPSMQTIELAFTEPTDHATTGFRLTTSGSRIYRPALRRPVLPTRLFLKRSPIAPGGSIIFDASGSMGVNQELLLDCCLRAPAATVAFYSGDDSPHGQGILYVYAKNGMRAVDVKGCTMFGGNGIDGQALDWLMEQESPRIFVTDRGFCGSGDSYVQLARLSMLEELGEVTVYESYHKFQDEFPPVAQAA